MSVSMKASKIRVCLTQSRMFQYWPSQIVYVILLCPTHQTIPVPTLMLRLHTRPREPIVIDPAVRMESDISVTHNHLSEEVDAVVEMIHLISEGVGIMVIVRIIRLADFVYAMKRVKDVKGRKITALFVI